METGSTKSIKAPLTSWLGSATEEYLTDRALRREAAAVAACPLRGQIVDVGGRAVHVHVQGNGPDLILLHGASGNLREFDELGSLLAQQYRVIALDRPGLGYSQGLDLADVGLAAQARHLAAAAERLGVHRPLILGHSYGGAVALAWAIAGLLQPSGLMLISAPTMPWDGWLDNWYRVTRTEFGQRHAIPAVAAFVPRAVLTKSVREVFAPESVPDTYFVDKCISLAIRRETLRHNTAQINRLLADIQTQLPHYGEVRVPVELLHGTQDGVVPFHLHSQLLTLLLPDSILTPLQDAGHMPHLTRIPDVLAALSRLTSRAALRVGPQSQY
jgi:pimeloyl-ACP methyl ester carboxylesterase